MEVNWQTIAAMRAVTVSREYGSGGGEIAGRLAQRLGWRLVDHEVIVQVARELAIPLHGHPNAQSCLREQTQYANQQKSSLLEIFAASRNGPVNANIPAATEYGVGRAAFREVSQWYHNQVTGWMSSLRCRRKLETQRRTM